MLPWAHPIPNPKQHRDRFSRFFTAHGRVDILYNGPPVFSQKLPIPIRGSLGPLESQPKRHLDRFSRLFAALTAEHPCTLQWSALSPSKSPCPMGYMDSHLMIPWAHMSP